MRETSIRLRELRDKTVELLDVVGASEAGARPSAERAGIRAFAASLAAVDFSQAERGPGDGATLPVRRHWARALSAAGPAAGPAAALADAVATLAPALRWSQNPNYRRKPPSPEFLDNYGYAVFAGPADGAPALAAHPTLAFGVLLLGPHSHYPLHRHPATELYVPLGAAEWWRDDGPWRREVAGAVIHHPPDVPHATRTAEAPLAALYLWRGALAVHAELIGVGQGGISSARSEACR